MTPVLAVVAELGHYSALLPLAACTVLLWRRRDPGPDAWLLSAAFFVSFVADQVGAQLQARGLPNWWLAYLYAPLQFGLFLAVVAQHRTVRAIALLGLSLLAVVSVLRGPLDTPETMTRVVGGVLVGGFIVGVPTLASYQRAVSLYCLGTAPWLLAMGALPLDSGAWVWCWIGYQGVRVMALLLMTHALVTSRLRLEVEHGSRLGPAARGDRRAGWIAGRRGRHELAPSKR